MVNHGARRTKSETAPPTGPPSGTTQVNETIAASDWGELCVEGCLYSGHHNGKDMVRCCHCASWMHTDCIAVKEEFVPGVWPCFKCRQMSSQVRGLASSVDALTELVQSPVSNIEDLKQQQQQTARLLREREENCEKLITEMPSYASASPMSPPAPVTSGGGSSPGPTAQQCWAAASYTTSTKTSWWRRNASVSLGGTSRIFRPKWTNSRQETSSVAPSSWLAEMTATVDRTHPSPTYWHNTRTW